jgi:hypothetical protein
LFRNDCNQTQRNQQQNTNNGAWSRGRLRVGRGIRDQGSEDDVDSNKKYCNLYIELKGMPIEDDGDDPILKKNIEPPKKKQKNEEVAVAAAIPPIHLESSADILKKILL